MPEPPLGREEMIPLPRDKPENVLNVFVRMDDFALQKCLSYHCAEKVLG